MIFPVRPLFNYRQVIFEFAAFDNTRGYAPVTGAQYILHTLNVLNLCLPSTHFDLFSSIYHFYLMFMLHPTPLPFFISLYNLYPYGGFPKNEVPQ